MSAQAHDMFDLQELAKQELVNRALAKEEFASYINYMNAPWWKWNFHHAELCDELQTVERRIVSGEGDNLIVAMPPRHGKSAIVSEGLPGWFIGRNPDMQVIATSYGADLAAGFGRELKNAISGERYQNVFPGVQLAADSKAANRWNIAGHRGRYRAAGVSGPITGFGAHLLIIDDYFKNDAEADSPGERKKVWDWYRQTFLTRRMPGCGIVIVATRWHVDDLIGKALQAVEEDITGDLPQWRVINYEALDEDNDDEPLWPEQYGKKALRAQRAIMDARSWYSLYQQRPYLDTGGYFDTGKMKHYHPAKLEKKLNIYMSGDFAVTANQSADKTEIGVFGMDEHFNTYILDWWAGQEQADTWITKLLDFAEEYEPICFFGEVGVIRNAIEPALLKEMQERNVYVTCEWLSVSGDKPSKARSFQARYNNGKVYFPTETTPWVKPLKKEMAEFPAGTYDDGVDALGLYGRGLDHVWKANKPEKVKPLAADELTFGRVANAAVMKNKMMELIEQAERAGRR